ncbi:esterase FE4-like [Planococcus citri]|uniref:esterase FE4-like n=1 Tax=Planococcus citri TaxID=170843 RepID=UPI0031F8401F
MLDSNEIIVRVNEGQIRGIKQTSTVFQSQYYSFYGIPYAQPPLKDLRFKDPVKASPWKRIRNAMTPRDPCLQWSPIHCRMIGSEDCLYVNVYTPELPQENHSPKAVLVFLHPGSFMWGSPNPEDHGSPNFLMHHDVVYVTVGFRLNIFGFLNLNMEECSGNQGLKDAVMAFQWIRENIHAFNGDPNNITAIGSSSGALMIHMLLLSPSVTGLFHKAILMGFYAFSCVTPRVEDHTERALKFAQELGFKGDDPRKMLRFLKKMPAAQLSCSVSNFQVKLYKDIIKSYIGGPFNESLDSTIMPVNPRQLLSTMERIPIIFGICDKEAICGFINSEEETIDRNLHAAYRIDPWSWPHNLTDQELDEMNKQIYSFYLENLPEKTTAYCRKIDIITDAVFSEVYDTLIDPISQSYPVYVYKFQYPGEISLFRRAVLQGLSEPVNGTYHSDDVSYWAHQITPDRKMTLQVVNNFTTLFCTFAKTGNPNNENIEVIWKPSTSENPCYLDIDEKLTMVDGKLNGERSKFWDNLKAKFKHD